MGQPPGFRCWAPNLDHILIGGASPNATVHIELGKPRQGEQKIGDVLAQFVKKTLPVDIIPQRQANLGVKPF
ncbi:hypothetical protein VA596_05400 [Amycolatopsis sp., V23-08]|uniref:Uncharacterized protein n=1 Tax=Amycolatopsis heterodermiae TaxID=3110235 RepID=A0ABU5QYF5_9PSEU|nr:hypothetical protein [Amycolatopsis sp., V23-08]MEA5358962.1 hypothetical protein [Amycolatopsis sp., V23-08]